MYHMEFSSPTRRLMNLMAENSDYSEAYIDGLMYIHDLICDMHVHPQPREYSPEAIHENMAEMLKPDVYISFSSRDREEVAVKLADDLRANGMNVWIALPGTGLPDNWIAALDHSASFIAIMSPMAAESRWIEQEWALANQLKKPTVAYLLDYSDRDYLPDTLKHGDFFGPDLNWSFQDMIVELRSKRSDNRLPFEMAENLRLNYDAARRIWFMGDPGRFGQFYSQDMSRFVESGALDVEEIATHFIDGLISTYTDLSISEGEGDPES